MVNLFNWLLNLTNVFAQFSSWLINPLILGYSPLEMFSVAGLTALIIVHVAKLLL